MKTNSLKLEEISMETQVARSKSIEWMVESYSAWQQHSPLPSLAKRNFLYMLKLASTKALKLHR
ncbi:MAG: hypothetical protein WCI92_00895 [Bacteroidota bacterium]